MRIGELAAATATGLQALRFYERRGLLGKTVRLNSGYRDFPPETIRIVLYIKQSQALGFTLNEIKELLALRETAGNNSTEVRNLARAKLESVESKLKSLERMRDDLKHVLRTCDCGESGAVRRSKISISARSADPRRRFARRSSRRNDDLKFRLGAAPR